MRFCIRFKKPYVTIDCKHDHEIHINSSVSIISHEFLTQHYPALSVDEMIRFASATAAVAVMHYPISDHPPTMERVMKLIESNL